MDDDFGSELCGCFALDFFFIHVFPVTVVSALSFANEIFEVGGQIGLCPEILDTIGKSVVI